MRRPLSFLAAAAFAALAAGAANAGSPYKDRVHADSYGNLVIHSAAGHKRIIVGMGHTAASYNQTGSYYEPDAAEADEARPQRQMVYCWRPPHVWHGRSHMYGLPDGVVPQAPIVCK